MMKDGILIRHEDSLHSSLLMPSSSGNSNVIELLQARLDSQQKSGKLKESVVTMESLLQKLREKYGDESVEFSSGVEKLCQLHNMAAMRSLEKEAFDECLESLRKAESLQHNSDKMRAVSFNNMACYYRRRNKLRTALNYLLNALSIELRLDETEISLADTHINLCAVLSQLDRHSEALEHSMLSIIMLQDEMLRKTLIKHPSQELSPQTQEQQQQQLQQQQEQVPAERIAVLTIAYHNLGVEYEHLKREEESIKLYTKSHQMASTYLGGDHSVAKKLEIVLANAQQERQTRKQKAEEKAHESAILSGNKMDIYRDKSRGGEDSTTANLTYKKSLSKALPKLRLQSSPKTKRSKKVDHNSSVNDQSGHFDLSEGSQIRSIHEASRINSVDKRQNNPRVFATIDQPSKSSENHRLVKGFFPPSQDLPNLQKLRMRKISQTTGFERNTIDVADHRISEEEDRARKPVPPTDDFKEMRSLDNYNQNHNYNQHQQQHHHHQQQHIHRNSSAVGRQITNSSSQERLMDDGINSIDVREQDHSAMNNHHHTSGYVQNSSYNQSKHRRISVQDNHQHAKTQAQQQRIIHSYLGDAKQLRTHKPSHSLNTTSNNLYRVEPESVKSNYHTTSTTHKAN